MRRGEGYRRLIEVADGSAQLPGRAGTAQDLAKRVWRQCRQAVVEKSLAELGEVFILRRIDMATATPDTSKTPRELGFSMTAEWERHEATWLRWPHNATHWPGKLDTIRWGYGGMVRNNAARELVRILGNYSA